MESFTMRQEARDGSRALKVIKQRLNPTDNHEGWAWVGGFKWHPRNVLKYLLMKICSRHDTPRKLLKLFIMPNNFCLLN